MVAWTHRKVLVVFWTIILGELGVAAVLFYAASRSDRHSAYVVAASGVAAAVVTIWSLGKYLRRTRAGSFL